MTCKYLEFAIQKKYQKSSLNFHLQMFSASYLDAENSPSAWAAGSACCRVNSAPPRKKWLETSRNSLFLAICYILEQNLYFAEFWRENVPFALFTDCWSTTVLGLNGLDIDCVWPKYCNSGTKWGTIWSTPKTAKSRQINDLCAKRFSQDKTHPTTLRECFSFSQLIL